MRDSVFNVDSGYCERRRIGWRPEIQSSDNVGCLEALGLTGFLLTAYLHAKVAYTQQVPVKEAGSLAYEVRREWELMFTEALLALCCDFKLNLVITVHESELKLAPNSMQ